MDDFDLYDSSEKGEGDTYYGVIVGHVVVIGIGIWLCKWCCRRSPPPVEKEVLDVQHLQPRKRLLTSYVLWLCGGFFGAHHFYLDRVVHGTMCVFSLNVFFLGFGWDAVRMPAYVRDFNSRRCAPAAPYDSSHRLLLVTLPCRFLLLLFVLAGFAVYTPSLLHRAGVVDIDRLAAQTEVNPYELLGLSRNAGLLEAKAAYRKESLRWHPDRNPNCGQKCTDKMSEITKAFDLIKRRQAPLPVEGLWDALRDRAKWKAFGENLFADWHGVVQELAGKDA